MSQNLENKGSVGKTTSQDLDSVGVTGKMLIQKRFPCAVSRFPSNPRLIEVSTVFDPWLKTVSKSCKVEQDVASGDQRTVPVVQNYVSRHFWDPQRRFSERGSLFSISSVRNWKG